MRWAKLPVLAQLSTDHLHYAADIRHDFRIPEADHPIAATRQLGGSFAVFILPFDMLSAIELDGQLMLRIGKIDDKRPDRVLPAKTLVRQLLSQRSPQPPLSLRRIAP